MLFSDYFGMNDYQISYSICTRFSEEKYFKKVCLKFKSHTKLIYGPPADERDLKTKSENFKVMHILKILFM